MDPVIIWTSNQTDQTVKKHKKNNYITIRGGRLYIKEARPEASKHGPEKTKRKKPGRESFTALHVKKYLIKNIKKLLTYIL